MRLKTILLLTIFAVLTACHADLDIQQKSEVSANSMWQDEGELPLPCIGYIINSDRLFPRVICIGENTAQDCGVTD
jgi:hypothetical protein